MSFPPMRYDEDAELYGSRPIDEGVEGLLAMFFSPAPDAPTRLGLSVACAAANSEVMGDLYEELIPLGVDVAFNVEMVGTDAVRDLVHKAIAFGEAKMLSRITIAAQVRALRECPEANSHAV